mmetsp:Transcript_53643/g.166082  ORF Transcript_53643/g.166082 Transcript_53643/m.166082 type:complete len:221 (-) Transcript_53643:514-1176(-)
MRLLCAVHVQAQQELREAPGDDAAHHGSPDALWRRGMPRLCAHVRDPAVQPEAPIVAGPRRTAPRTGAHVHQPRHPLRGDVREVGGVPAERPFHALPRRRGQIHGEEGVPRRPHLPPDAHRGAPRHHGDEGHRVAGPADGGGDGEHDDIHGGHRGLHVLVGGVYGRLGGQHRRLVHHGELPGPDQRPQGGIHSLPRRVHAWGARWLRGFNRLPDETPGSL